MANIHVNIPVIFLFDWQKDSFKEYSQKYSPTYSSSKDNLGAGSELHSECHQVRGIRCLRRAKTFRIPAHSVRGSSNKCKVKLFLVGVSDSYNFLRCFVPYRSSI